MPQRLSRSTYRRFVIRYDGSEFENRDGVTWLDYNAERHFQLCQAFLACRPALGEAPPILDVGGYPGTMLKLLRLLLGEKGRLVGVGLGGNDSFIRHLQEYGVEFTRCNLDPMVRSPDPSVEALPRRIPYADRSFRFIFCTEVIEHLLDPSLLLREIRRVAVPGGLALFTTPNQLHVTNRVRALLGRSIYHPLRESIMYRLTNWRPHLREYTLAELTALLEDHGLRVVWARFVDTSPDDLRLLLRPRLHRRLFKLAQRILFALWPSMRHGIMVLARA